MLPRQKDPQLLCVSFREHVRYALRFFFQVGLLSIPAGNVQTGPPAYSDERPMAADSLSQAFRFLVSRPTGRLRARAISPSLLPEILK
jgi:hypothetical protein